jgi:hypothetical protein
MVWVSAVSGNSNPESFRLCVERCLTGAIASPPYELPDGQVIELGAQRFAIAETLFNPAILQQQDDATQGRELRMLVRLSPHTARLPSPRSTHHALAPCSRGNGSSLQRRFRTLCARPSRRARTRCRRICAFTPPCLQLTAPVPCLQLTTLAPCLQLTVQSRGL